MAKEDKNISISSINSYLEKSDLIRGSSTVRNSWLGLNARRMIVPADVISWITTHDLSREGQKYHSRYVLKIPLSGVNITCLDGHFLELRPGSALLILPYQVHANLPHSESCQPPEFLLVTFSLPQLEAQQNIAALKNRIIPFKESWFARVLKIIRAYQRPDEISEAEAVFTLAGVLTEMAGCLSETEKQEENPALFAEICDHVRKNFRDDLDVNTLAEHFSLSSTTLRRLFNKNFGGKVTPSHFIESIRIQHAVTQLLYTADPIAKIAAECGYLDQFGFSRAFRRITGISPRKYREQHKSS